MANVPISRNSDILNGANLSPSETDPSNNLASVPYSSSATPNSIVYRDSSGNSSVNELTISGLSANEFSFQQHPWESPNIDFA